MMSLSLSSLLLACLLSWLRSISLTASSCTPSAGCSVALGNYIVSSGDTVQNIALRFQVSEASIQDYSNLEDANSISPGQALSIPFSCDDCSDDRLEHIVSYTIASGDTLDNVVSLKFSNLSQTQWVVSASGNIDPNNLQPGSFLSIPINCSCGNPDVSLSYGLFRTYVIQSGDTLTSLSQKYGVDSDLLSKYNQDVDFSKLVAYEDIVFVPAKDGNGVYLPYTANGTGGGNKSAIIGGSVGGVIVFASVVGLLLYLYMTRRRKRDQLPKQEIALLKERSSGIAYNPFADSGDGVFKFSYENLAVITDNFSLSKKIGAGGFGTVYYAEINKQRLAIKRMDMNESKQFIAEVDVLARVHHTNLVQLVGWCEENGLFLVYEYVENGTLRSHLDAPQRGGTSLTWASRLQIAIDSARGLEYIHEYTVPSYMHRDIKPDNILLDNRLHAKVADFGLAKLGEITGTAKAAGTVGYMAPESTMYGVLSPKVDVFAFGVVLMQLVSAKDPILVMNNGEKVSLPGLFEGFMKDSDTIQNLSNFVDPTLKDVVLQDEHTRDSIWKVIQLACECTSFDPDKRPDMRKVVTILSTLSYPTRARAFDALNVHTGNSI